ncbi:UNVERIFIED_CONTAM: hypothetical protein K2H54_048916 [Gekko kuhli]
MPVLSGMGVSTILYHPGDLFHTNTNSFTVLHIALFFEGKCFKQQYMNSHNNPVGRTGSSLHLKLVEKPAPADLKMRSSYLPILSVALQSLLFAFTKAYHIS